MSEQTSRTTDSTAQPQAPRRTRYGLTIAAVAIAAGLTGAAITTAFSQGDGFGPGGWHGRGMMHGGFMHGGMMGRAFDPARAEERADRMVRHLVVELDATNEQQDKLRALVKATMKDVLPVREKAMAARQQARSLLSAPTIDRVAIEKLRAEQIATADIVSKRLAQALADAADILTPEQRTKLNENFPFRGFRHGWRRG